MVHFGIKWYAAYEVLNSPWLLTELTAAHKDRIPPTAEFQAGTHHYILALKEDLFECIARGYVVHGPFATFQSACEHAASLVTLPNW
jgi:hypothetical protein